MNKLPHNLDFDNVDILRSLLALGIVWHHMIPPEAILGIPINIPGRVLVWLFYVLSGYVISRGFYEGRYVFSKASILQFYKKRLLRLLPLLYFVYVTVWFIGYRHEPFWTLEHFQELFFLQYNFNFSYIGVAWFLGPLVYFYLISPFLFEAIEKLKLRASPIKFLIRVSVVALLLKYASACLSLLLGLGGNERISSYLDDRTVLGNLGAFLIGATIWPLFQRYESHLRAKGRMRCAVWGIAGILAAAVLYEVKAKAFWILPTVNIVTLSGVAVILACLASPLLIKGRVQADFKFLNPLSYGLFLWHGLILELLRNIFPDYNTGYAPFVLAFISVTMICYGLAFFSYVLIEKNGLFR